MPSNKVNGDDGRRWDDVKGLAERYPFFTENSVRARVARGTIPYHRIGKRIVFDLDEVDDFIFSSGITAEQARENLKQRTEEEF